MKNRPTVKEQRGGKGTQRHRTSTQKPEEPPTLRVSRRAGLCNVWYAPPGGGKPQNYSYPDDSDASDIDVDVTCPGVVPALLPQLRHQAQQFCEEDFPPVKKTPRKINKLRKTKKIKDKIKKGSERKPGNALLKEKSDLKTKADVTPKSVKFENVPLKKVKSQNATEVKGKKVANKSQEKLGQREEPPKLGKNKKVVKVHPWDNWVMKVQCKDDLTMFRSAAKNRKKRKDLTQKGKPIADAQK